MYGSDWRADVARAGGGTLLEHSIHDVDVLRWLLGDPASVSARVSSRFGHSGIDDTAVVTFGYSDGSTAMLVSVWHQILTRGSSRRLEIFCERGFLWTDDDHLGPLHLETASGTRSVTADPPDWTELWAGRLGLAPEHAAPLARYAGPALTFLGALAAGTPPAATGAPDAATALAAHRLVDLAYRSAAAGGTPLRLDAHPDSGSAAPR
jgi:predicted dehydrogenase